MNREGRFFGTLEALTADMLRYNSRLDYMTLVTATKPNRRMVFEDGKISWHLIECYEDVWMVSGLQFTQVTFDISLGTALFQQECGNEELLKVVHYVMTRVRGMR